MRIYAPLATVASLASVLACFPALATGPAAAGTFSTIHSFVGPDGATPESGVPVFDRSGALYGTSTLGGTHNNGVVFKLTPPVTPGGAWTETVIYSFTGGSDGGTPIGGLIFDNSGTLYGTTQYGPGEFAGNGTVFKLTPPGKTGGTWTHTTLHTFIGSDGSRPIANMIFDRFGALYGTTYVGGAQNSGTVFKLTPPIAPSGKWAETVLYSFPGPNHVGPSVGLIFDDLGALYGTTTNGGARSGGTVFKLAPPAPGGSAWVESDLHAFSGSDGEEPLGSLIFDSRGALYGTTLQGGADGFGLVFKLTPPSAPQGSWTETALHTFTAVEGPLGGVTFDSFGALYGTTGGNTAAPHQGTVFKLTPPAIQGHPWIETVVHAFTGNDGIEPEGSLVFDRFGALYGITLEGGGNCPFLGDIAQFGCGTVFKFTPPAAPASVVSFTAHGSTANGVGPLVNVIVDGETIGSTSVGTTSATYSFNTVLSANTTHDIQLQYVNDTVIAGQDRNLILSSIGINGQTVLATSTFEVYHSKVGGGPGDIASNGNMYWDGAAEFKVPASYFPPMTAAANTLRTSVHSRLRASN